MYWINKTDCLGFFYWLNELSVKYRDQLNYPRTSIINKDVFDHFLLQYYLCKSIPSIYKKCIGKIIFKLRQVDI